MAIAKMNKFSLFAFKKDKERLLSNLQRFEGVQFINLQDKLEQNEDENELSVLQMDSEEVKVSDIEGDIAKVKSALEFLNLYIPKEKGMKVMLEGKRTLTYDEVVKESNKVDFLKICDEIKEIEQRLASLKTEISGIENEISFLKPWQSLDISLDQLDKLSFAVPFLGAVPMNLKEKFIQEAEANIKSVYLESISDTREGANFFIIAHKDEVIAFEEIQKKYGFTSTSLNFKGICKEQIADLQERLVSCKNEIEEKTKGIQEFKDDIPQLELGYEYLSNEANKARITSNFMKTEQTVVIEGWVSKDASEKFNNLIEESSDGKYYLEIEEADKDEDVPILLKNKKIFTPFESFISMYGMPHYNGMDPTAVMAPFYMIFYGMMLSDAGYGILQLLGCLFILKKAKLTESMRNMVLMFLYLSIPTIIVGALYGSWFCGAIKIPPIWMDPAQDVILLLIVACGCGLIHILTGLGLKGYLLLRDGKVLDFLFDVVFWAVAVLSLIVALAGTMGGVEALKGVAKPSQYVLYASLIGLVLTQGRDSKSIGGKLGSGLYEVYGITGYIGDIVSYSRLMALGLATGFVGGAFNSMIDLMGNGVAAWIGGPIIFIVGHLFNLFINALGSYVHSLRLQYSEFFGKFYESGGKPFTPFKPKSKYINIVKN